MPHSAHLLLAAYGDILTELVSLDFPFLWGKLSAPKFRVIFYSLLCDFKMADIIGHLAIRTSKENFFFYSELPHLSQKDRCLLAKSNSPQLARDLRLGLSGAGFVFPKEGTTGTAF